MTLAKTEPLKALVVFVKGFSPLVGRYCHSNSRRQRGRQRIQYLPEWIHCRIPLQTGTLPSRMPTIWHNCNHDIHLPCPQLTAKSLFIPCISAKEMCSESIRLDQPYQIHPQCFCTLQSRSVKGFPTHFLVGAGLIANCGMMATAGIAN